jgi:PKHD-type hydroxylase
MIIIENFLPQDKLEELKAILATCKYVDGIETAGGAAAKDMKSNLQVDHKDPNGAKANEYVLENVKACQPLQAYALPYKIGPITFSRYHEGMKYNNHIDAAIMPMPGAFLRTDVSFTIFLSGPDEYEGGELVIISDSTENSFKGKAGTLVAYSSGLLHRVNEVRSGSREVAPRAEANSDAADPNSLTGPN